MNAKKNIEIIIAGKVYTISGKENEDYYQKIAYYINSKWNELRNSASFKRQSPDYQTVMLELNIADDYLKVSNEEKKARIRIAELEKEIYSLKHELVAKKLNYDELKNVVEKNDKYKNTI